MDTRKKFRIAGIFDTETTTIGKGADCVAFPIAYICNDLRNVDIAKYKPERDDDIGIVRGSDKFVDWIDDLVHFFERKREIPIIAAYNLSFDLHSVMTILNDKYDMTVLAQSRTGYYCVDLRDGERLLLRFWDTFYLEMNGLQAMGNTCGFAKAVGDWDYSLIRTQSTPLTDAEVRYCKSDVQVIPAYLKWLLKANPHLKADDFGNKCMTKTSIVRLLGARTVGAIEENNSRLGRNFELLAKNENSPNFATYVWRKTAFRGGLTFTSGAYASQVFENVASFDVVSMHHLFINGRELPYKFRAIEEKWLGRKILREVKARKVSDILFRYNRPFDWSFHIKIRVHGVRLKKGSIFEKEGIGTLPAAKFERFKEEEVLEYAEDFRNLLIDSVVKKWGDKHKKGVFAFSKLIKAEMIEVTLSELEYWIFEQVYDYDRLEFVEGEATNSFQKVPAYVSCLSNMLFEQKECLKNVLRTYQEGKKWNGDTSLLPDSISQGIKEGSFSRDFLDNYYRSTIKGAFNSVYGIMAMDIYKPDFEIEKGDVSVVKSTLPNETNFFERTPKNVKVLYTYGLRIVGGSRLHLVLAMLLIHEALGDAVKILGGDTDSLKVHLSESVTPDDVLRALAPLHVASTKAIDDTQIYIRRKHPEYASSLKDVGLFEYEGTNALHVELWNKGRVVWTGEKMKVTLAGVPRPKGINLEKCLEEYAKKYSPREALEKASGYNTVLTPAVSRFLSVKRPDTGSFFDDEVTDYLGQSAHVQEFQAIALYENTKEIGSTLALSNRQNVKYLRKRGIYPDLFEKRFRYYDDTIYFSYNDEEESL